MAKLFLNIANAIPLLIRCFCQIESNDTYKILGFSDRRKSASLFLVCGPYQIIVLLTEPQLILRW